MGEGSTGCCGRAEEGQAEVSLGGQEGLLRGHDSKTNA